MPGKRKIGTTAVRSTRSKKVKAAGVSNTDAPVPGVTGDNSVALMGTTDTPAALHPTTTDASTQDAGSTYSPATATSGMSLPATRRVNVKFAGKGTPLAIGQTTDEAVPLNMAEWTSRLNKWWESKKGEINESIDRRVDERVAELFRSTTKMSKNIDSRADARIKAAFSKDLPAAVDTMVSVAVQTHLDIVLPGEFKKYHAPYKRELSSLKGLVTMNRKSHNDLAGNHNVLAENYDALNRGHKSLRRDVGSLETGIQKLGMDINKRLEEVIGYLKPGKTVTGQQVESTGTAADQHTETALSIDTVETNKSNGSVSDGSSSSPLSSPPVLSDEDSSDPDA